MNVRRFSIGCGVVAVLAVAGYVPAAASSSATSKTICIGVIVDPHTLGKPVNDACVNVKPGTTGVGVLEAAGHTVTFRRDGLLCTIDGLPESGCSAVDNLHYWAYFHREPDSTTWSYSSEGASTYKPENRETEGWVYDNGVPQMPENIPAAKMCAGLVKGAPAPTPDATKTHRMSTHAHPSSASPSSSTSATATRSPRKTHHHRHRQSAKPSAAASVPGAVDSPSAVATRAANTDKAGNGSATGAIVAAVLIAVIATATVVGARRRRR